MIQKNLKPIEKNIAFNIYYLIACQIHIALEHILHQHHWNTEKKEPRSTPRQFLAQQEKTFGAIETKRKEKLIETFFII